MSMSSADKEVNTSHRLRARLISTLSLRSPPGRFRGPKFIARKPSRVRAYPMLINIMSRSSPWTFSKFVHKKWLVRWVPKELLA